jgi:hypothetical protein
MTTWKVQVKVLRQVRRPFSRWRVAIGRVLIYDVRGAQLVHKLQRYMRSPWESIARSLAQHIHLPKRKKNPAISSRRPVRLSHVRNPHTKSRLPSAHKHSRREPVTVVEERWIRFHPPLFGLVMRLGGSRVVVSSVSVELNTALLRLYRDGFFSSRVRSSGTYITSVYSLQAWV